MSATTTFTSIKIRNIQELLLIKKNQSANIFEPKTNYVMIDASKKFPMPPFTQETALQKVQAAEDAWNTKDPEKVCLAYTVDTEWRNRTEFINGREEVKIFLTQKWEKELDYKLKKELWGFRENRMAVRFEYEWHDQAGQWFRSYGNELWEFDENGFMQKRYASINDLAIEETERKLK